MDNGYAGSQIIRTYKTIGNCELQLKIYTPFDWEPTDQRPVIVFFFGSGWVKGSVDHLKLQSHYLASRGMVAITPDYRVKSIHGTTPVESVEDGRDAVRWVYEFSKEIGIDRERIVVGGASSGGQVALYTVLENGDVEEHNTSTIPKAVVLFNPVVNCKGYEIMGNMDIKLSPYHNIRENMPPVILFNGTDDDKTTYVQTLKFTKKMIETGNKCTLVAYEGEKHGFFNYREEDPYCFYETLQRTERFLKYLDFL